MYETQTIVTDVCGVCPSVCQSVCHVGSFGTAFPKSLCLVFLHNEHTEYVYKNNLREYEIIKSIKSVKILTFSTEHHLFCTPILERHNYTVHQKKSRWQNGANYYAVTSEPQSGDCGSAHGTIPVPVARL